LQNAIPDCLASACAWNNQPREHSNITDDLQTKDNLAIVGLFRLHTSLVLLVVAPTARALIALALALALPTLPCSQAQYDTKAPKCHLCSLNQPQPRTRRLRHLLRTQAGETPVDNGSSGRGGSRGDGGLRLGVRGGDRDRGPDVQQKAKCQAKWSVRQGVGQMERAITHFVAALDLASANFLFLALRLSLLRLFPFSLGTSTRWIVMKPSWSTTAWETGEPLGQGDENVMARGHWSGKVVNCILKDEMIEFHSFSRKDIHNHIEVAIIIWHHHEDQTNHNQKTWWKYLVGFWQTQCHNDISCFFWVHSVLESKANNELFRSGAITSDEINGNRRDGWVCDIKLALYVTKHLEIWHRTCSVCSKTFLSKSSSAVVCVDFSLFFVQSFFSST